MKDDTISRAAAIDALNDVLADYIPYLIGRNEEIPLKCAVAIRDLPSAQPTDADIQRMQDIEQAALEKAYECGKKDAMQWIPCSERLPSLDFTDVLVCMHDVRHGCEDEYYIASAYVVRGHWEMTLNVDTSDLEIVAWMPLPKPWEGGEK